jgi:hypothetical protein
MVQFGIELGASSLPVSGPAAERPDVRRRELLNRLRFLVVLCVAVLASGCMATFSERPPLPSYAGPSSPMAVRLESSGEDFLYLTRDKRIEAPFSTSLAGVAAEAISRSGWVRVTPGSESSASLSVHVINSQGPGPGLLPTLTAFLIPGVVDHQIDVRVRLSRSDASYRDCEGSVVIRTWYQTFFLFLYPFRSPAYNRMKSAEALALSCVAELLRYEANSTRS